MGGHGALICALKNAGMYRSVSAFAPICNPENCGWGQGCFGAYLGDNKHTWEDYDATSLVKHGAQKLPVLIDSGLDDEFLAEQLHPRNLLDACEVVDFPITLRMQDGYDHSYHFISTFIGEHLAFHETHLRG